MYIYIGLRPEPQQDRRDPAVGPIYTCVYIYIYIYIFIHVHIAFMFHMFVITLYYYIAPVLLH